jgi:hypothetical protein
MSHNKDPHYFYQLFFFGWVPLMVAQWLRYCATNRKVVSSIPYGANGIFHWHNPSDRTVALCMCVCMYVCVCVWVCVKLPTEPITHTHTHIYTHSFTHTLFCVFNIITTAKQIGYVLILYCNARSDSWDQVTQIFTQIRASKRVPLIKYWLNYCRGSLFFCTILAALGVFIVSFECIVYKAVRTSCSSADCHVHNCIYTKHRVRGHHLRHSAIYGRSRNHIHHKH